MAHIPKSVQKRPAALANSRIPFNGEEVLQPPPLVGEETSESPASPCYGEEVFQTSALSWRGDFRVSFLYPGMGGLLTVKFCAKYYTRRLTEFAAHFIP